MSNEDVPRIDLPLVPEAIKKLNIIIAKAISGATKAKDELPEKLQELIASVTITSKLNDDSPDQLEVQINFKVNFNSSLFKITMLHSKLFYVDCLTENIEAVVEKKFKEEVHAYMKELFHFLYSSANEVYKTIT